MKLPYSESHYLLLKQNHKLQVSKIRKIEYDSEEYKSQLEHIKVIFNLIMEYENIRDYNIYAKNICMFGKSGDTLEVCERKFKNTLYIYSVRGNCCEECNHIFNSKKYKDQ